MTNKLAQSSGHNTLPSLDRVGFTVLYRPLGRLTVGGGGVLFAVVELQMRTLKNNVRGARKCGSEVYTAWACTPCLSHEILILMTAVIDPSQFHSSLVYNYLN